MASPLEEYEKEHHDRWTILVDVPEWERQTIISWLYGIFVSHKSDMLGVSSSQFNRGIINAIERNKRVSISSILRINPTDWPDLRKRLWELVESNSQPFILFLELVVVYIRDYAPRSITYGDTLHSDSQVLEYLQRSLANGSKWQIVEQRNATAGLVEVVSPELTEIAKSIEDDDLTAAWHAAFQPTPEPEKAVEKAQSAIEALAAGHNLTTVTSKVYGVLLNDIRANKGKSYISIAKPEFDMSNVLAGEKSSEQDINDQFADWIWMGMNIIQKTNPKRHRNQQNSQFKVSPDAAKQAVLVATVLAHLIKEGYFVKDAKKTNKQPVVKKEGGT